jgi:hypothetical protein
MGLGPPRDPRTEAGLQRSTSTGSPIRTIALLALLSRIVPLALLHLLPIRTFDASASLLSPPTSSGISLTPLTTYTPPTLRWDAIHFATIALRGYTFEQQLAFQPGWPLVMRVAGEGVWWAKRLFTGLVSGDSSSILTSNDVVLGGVIAANAAFVGATIMLYKYVKTPCLALVFPLTSQTHLPNHLSLLRTTHYIPVPPPPNSRRAFFPVHRTALRPAHVHGLLPRRYQTIPPLGPGAWSSHVCARNGDLRGGGSWLDHPVWPAGSGRDVPSTFSESGFLHPTTYDQRG